MLIESEPNLVPDLPITKTLLDRRRRSLESYARFGAVCGLRRAEDGGPAMQLTLEASDVFQLRRLRAVGKKGHPLIADPHVPGRHIAPLDASRLAVGHYDLYVCLEHETVTAGEEREFLPPGRGRAVRYRSDRYPRLSLQIDDHRLEHRDWMKVARFQRLRSGGVVRTHRDLDFHPPIQEMGAYLDENPLPALAETLLAACENVSTDPLARTLRYEAMALTAIADCGETQAVYSQTMRCLALASGIGLSLPVLDANLVAIRYSPESFCRFLFALRLSLEGQKPDAPPPVLEIDGVCHLRCDDEFRPEDRFWVWRPSRDGFVASGVALYIPSATIKTPFICYGQSTAKTESWPTAEIAEDLSHPGVALTMGQLEIPIEALYLRTSAMNQAQHLREQLGEGHAIYYR